MKTKNMTILILGLLIGAAIGWYFGSRSEKLKDPDQIQGTVPVDQARKENQDYIIQMKGKNPNGQIDLTGQDAQNLGILLRNIDAKKRYSLALGFNAAKGTYSMNLLTFNQSSGGEWLLEESAIKDIPVFPCPPACDKLELNWNVYPTTGETDEQSEESDSTNTESQEDPDPDKEQTKK
jgi:hypothetical protein